MSSGGGALSRARQQLTEAKQRNAHALRPRRPFHVGGDDGDDDGDNDETRSSDISSLTEGSAADRPSSMDSELQQYLVGLRQRATQQQIDQASDIGRDYLEDEDTGKPQVSNGVFFQVGNDADYHPRDLGAHLARIGVNQSLYRDDTDATVKPTLNGGGGNDDNDNTNDNDNDNDDFYSDDFEDVTEVVPTEMTDPHEHEQEVDVESSIAEDIEEELVDEQEEAVDDDDNDDESRATAAAPSRPRKASSERRVHQLQFDIPPVAIPPRATAKTNSVREAAAVPAAESAAQPSTAASVMVHHHAHPVYFIPAWPVAGAPSMASMAGGGLPFVGIPGMMGGMPPAAWVQPSLAATTTTTTTPTTSDHAASIAATSPARATTATSYGGDDTATATATASSPFHVAVKHDPHSLDGRW